VTGISKGFLAATAALFSTVAVLAAQSLTIYCENDPPNQYVDKSGQLSGFTIDVVHEIQRRIGNDDPIRLVPWARGYEAILTTPDVVLFQMTRTAERNPMFKWVGPLMEDTFALYGRVGARFSIASLDDAKKVGTIGVYRDDVRDLFLTKAGFTNLERTTDNIANAKKLMAGHIDLFAATTSSVGDIMKAAGYSGDDVKMVLPFMKVQVYIAFSNCTPDDIVRRWQGGLDFMKKDGSFARIFKNYFPAFDLPGPAITTF